MRTGVPLPTKPNSQEQPKEAIGRQATRSRSKMLLDPIPHGRQLKQDNQQEPSCQAQPSSSV
eukprot:3242506-Prorocentrum_lima.AAC.1